MMGFKWQRLLSTGLGFRAGMGMACERWKATLVRCHLPAAAGSQGCQAKALVAKEATRGTFRIY